MFLTIGIDIPLAKPVVSSNRYRYNFHNSVVPNDRYRKTFYPFIASDDRYQHVDRSPFYCFSVSVLESKCVRRQPVSVQSTLIPILHPSCTPLQLSGEFPNTGLSVVVVL